MYLNKNRIVEILGLERHSAHLPSLFPSAQIIGQSTFGQRFPKNSLEACCKEIRSLNEPYLVDIPAVVW